MASFVNVCRFNPTLGGSTDFTYSTAATGYQSPSAAGAVSGLTYPYRAESSDLSQWEVGYGVWNGTSLARTTILANSSGTTAKITFSTVPQVSIVALAQDLREKLDGARTYYVSTTGSDSNNGLSSGSPFLTLQKAFNTIASSLDLGGQTVTISCAAGTYGAGIDFSAGWTGGGAIIVSGAPCTISVASANCFQNGGNMPGVVTIQNLTLICTGTGGSAISNTGVGTINIGVGINFGDMAGADQIFAQGSSAYITCSTSYSISGGGRCHVFARDGAVVDLYNGGAGLTTTVTASVSFSLAFVDAQSLGAIKCIASTRTFSIGTFTVTGTRYAATLNAVINTQGGGANYFPGTVAGSAATGGQYA